MQIIDTHAHLDHCKNLEEALKNAKDTSLEAIVAVSEDLASCNKNLEISNKYNVPKIYCAMGIHPSKANIDELEETLGFIKDNGSRIVAVGEIGLDYWYPWVKKDKDKKEEQKKVFVSCLELSKNLGLPVIIHSRGAWRDCLDMVKESGIKKAVFHWYSGPLEVLEELLSLGYFVSATPSLEYSEQAQSAIKNTPVSQCLIETDTPVYYKNKEEGGGFCSEPRDVHRTLNLFCELKGVDKFEAAKSLNINAKNFFNII